jgi:hypothetical protein
MLMDVVVVDALKRTRRNSISHVAAEDDAA